MLIQALSKRERANLAVLDLWHVPSPSFEDVLIQFVLGETMNILIYLNYIGLSDL
jgi:hypothetical protein